MLRDNILEMFGIKGIAKRLYKGNSLLALVDDYVVVDLETTGYMPAYDSIIEVGAVKYEGGAEVGRFHTFVGIDFALNDFIVAHTGITDEMLRGAPHIVDVLPQLLAFIGDKTVVAHNANFDVNFIYDDALNLLNVKFQNNFIDTMRLAKKCDLPVENHKLATLAAFFGISQPIAHRALADCDTAHALYEKLKEYINNNAISLKPHYSATRVAGIQATTDDIDVDNPFYGKTVVFTGALDSMQRKDAAQIVANLGGILGDTITKKTNFLVLGNYAYCSTIKGGKSSKHKKAEQLILGGQDLQIIPESVFLSMIAEE